ncbi:homer 2 [Trichonephila clavipes]|nr:homer 2 [Trichonephila clavipes]
MHFKVVFFIAFRATLQSRLEKFIEKFQEVKEATRQAAQQKAQQQTNGSASTPVTSASASPCSSRSVPTPPVPSQTPTSESGGAEDCVPIAANQIDHVVSSLPSNVNDIANTLKSSLVAHQRSQSLSGLQASKYRPRQLNEVQNYEVRRQ